MARNQHAVVHRDGTHRNQLFFLFFTLVAGPRRSLSLKLSDTTNMHKLTAMARGVWQARSFFLSLPRLELSDTQVYEPCTRGRLGIAAQFCNAVVLKLPRRPRTSSGPRPRRTLNCRTLNCLNRRHDPKNYSSPVHREEERLSLYPEPSSL